MQTTSPSLHVILGAGQIGTRVADLLLEQGHRVRLVRRGSAAAPRQRLESLSGDITDLAFAEQAARGAAVVYDCMNPAYHLWPEQLLPIARGALHGATKAGARLVALDCLYMYGRPQGPLHEDSPLMPCSKKGELRVRLADMRLAAHRKGDVRLTIGRASDFFGPALPFSNWSDRFYQRILAGKPAECMGDPDMPHAYTYAEDVARALVTLGAEERALGQVWHLPTPAAESTRALASRLGHALGIGDVRVVRVPRVAMRLAGLFSPFLREAAEMMYQWEVPFLVDDSRYRAAFGQGPTPVDQAVRDTATWARRHYALRAHG
jgi:nucleoside-diphosphate-sugar epimerase